MLTKYRPVTLLCCRKMIFCVGLLLLFFTQVKGQEFFFSGNQIKQSLPFKSIKNLIVIPVFINGKGPFDFVLDTGVGPMIVTEPSIIDSLDFNMLRKIKVTGLGVETVEAYVSQNINASIGRAKIEHIPTAILKEDLFNLSGHLGIKVYGLIGFNFFNSFMVDVRYSENRIIFSYPYSRVKYRGKKVPIEIENLKPYITADVQVQDSGAVKGKFLMDTGASHALSMEMIDGGAVTVPERKIKANLGMSLSGQIKGYIARVHQISLGDQVFTNVVSGFPDYNTIADKIDLTKRNGNLGADLLRKFDIQFNYQQQFIYLKPNKYARLPFEHDMVGMVVYLDQQEYKRFLIGEIDENSPAERAGLCAKDEIIGVNFKPVDSYTLNDLTELFKSSNARNVIFEIYRDDRVFYVVVKLEKRI
ncbi:aspartyl protease family protein [Pedobacter paludis]|uniref:Peptide-binding protein n=1 Tax=Pedobacter paludis TaxID=2203212 RepID=A0A317F405_9SPHI|nr:aspartyl protease family protein [Pedobacter paludis]PWS32767.1 peptide-binding protein [Pedobacter paludis]